MSVAVQAPFTCCITVTVISDSKSPLSGVSLSAAADITTAISFPFCSSLCKHALLETPITATAQPPTVNWKGDSQPAPLDRKPATHRTRGIIDNTAGRDDYCRSTNEGMVYGLLSRRRPGWCSLASCPGRIIEVPIPFDPRWYSHKFHCAGLRCEINPPFLPAVHDLIWGLLGVHFTKLCGRNMHWWWRLKWWSHWHNDSNWQARLHCHAEDHCQG